MKAIKDIAIIGDGGWGTTLGILFSAKGFKTVIWGPFPAYIRCLQKTRVNKKFLPGVKIPREIVLTDDLELAVKNADLIVIAIPSKFAVPIIRRLKKHDLSKKMFLSVIKGVDDTSLLRMSQIIERELKRVPLAVLSGPTIAKEVAAGIPSSAVIASKNIRLARFLQGTLNTNRFRIYTNSDIIGVEIGGSVKNIIAIACGLCDGLGFGTNTKAALLTRGLAEITRLGSALGAKSKTFSGLSGLGDLVTTCFSPQSRNRYVGEQLGKGKHIRQITSRMAMVAEGVTTVRAIFRLSRKHHLSMPLTEEVYRIIYRNKDPRLAVKDLMQRKLKSE